jgi:hypothetical protein
MIDYVIDFYHNLTHALVYALTMHQERRLLLSQVVTLHVHATVFTA